MIPVEGENVVTRAQYIAFWGSMMTCGLGLGGLLFWKLSRIVELLAKIAEKL